jgi:hypothetical protein
MEHPRTDSARTHDDSDLIDRMSEDGGITSGSSAGGNLARDVASRNELAQVDDPEALTRSTKDIDIDNDQARRNNRPRD